MSKLIRYTCIFLAATALLCAQVGTGSVTGIVDDSTGAAMPGVAIEVKNVATGVTTTAISNQAGNYLVTNLIPGDYVLTANAKGFKRYVRSGLIVQVGESARVDIAMEVGAVVETVDVKSSAPLVETENGTLGSVIENVKVTQLPLNGRNVFSLMQLAAGAAPDDTGSLRINGSRSRSNEFLVDGVTQVIPETRSAQVSPPPVDSVAEFQVLTNAFSAEYGNSSGGLLNVASKSGTNELHGSMWEFLRNDKLNTRNFFTPATSSKPILRQNQFGFAVGGPVFLPKVYDGRNRTFFFTDYEGQRTRSQKVFSVNVPTAAMESGDFSSYMGSTVGTDSLGRTVAQGQIFDPDSERTVNGQIVRDPFPNNAVPTARFDPVAVKLLGYWPSPTNSASTQNFVRPTSTGSNNDRFDVRGDHEINSSNRVFAHFAWAKSTSLPSVAFRGTSGDYDNNETTAKTLSGSWTSTVSASKLNELRLSVLSWDRLVSPYLSGTSVASQLGIPNMSTAEGIPYIDISSVQVLGNAYSGGYNNGTDKVISAIDNFSIIHGGHTIKFGGEARIYRLHNYQPSLLNGSFTFRSAETSSGGAQTASTGNAFASFLLGVAHQTQYTQKDPGQEVNNVTYAGFVQDDIKVGRRLTVNIGMRYELNTILKDARGFDSTFDLATGRVLAGAARPDPDLDKNNFAPRAGFAWDITGKQTTVVRGAFGIFYQPTQGGGGNPLAGVVKFPYEFTSNAQSANGVDGVTTLSAGPVIQTEYDVNDTRLGYGTNVMLQTPNLAPYVEQWNLGVEHSVHFLGGDTLLGAAYVGSGGRKIEGGRLGYINLNQVPILLAQQAGAAQNTTSPDTSALKPWPNFNQVLPLLPRYGNSNYNSLQLKAERRLSGGFTFLASYVFSKSIDNTAETFGFTGGSWPQDVYNLSAERAVSTADIPHRFITSWVWNLPFGAGRRYAMHGVANAIAGGWQIAGIGTLQSGRPVDVEQSTNTSGTFSQMERPNISGNPNLSRDERSVNRYFDATVFSAAQALNFGTSPRNPIRAPGVVNFDASVNKQWAFQEKRLLEFRFEMFNFTNTPAFSLTTRTTYNPNLALNKQTFGQLTSAKDGRVLQFGLKLRF